MKVWIFQGKNVSWGVGKMSVEGVGSFGGVAPAGCDTKGGFGIHWTGSYTTFTTL